MGETTQETDAGRDASVPVEQWWYDMLEALVGRSDRAFQAKDIAAGIGVTADRISKVRHKVDSPIWLIEAISDFLKIPRPFASFPSRELAHEYALKLAKEAAKGVVMADVRREVAVIESGVSSPEYGATKRRTSKLQPTEHASSRAKRDRRSARRRGRVE